MLVSTIILWNAYSKSPDVHVAPTNLSLNRDLIRNVARCVNGVSMVTMTSLVGYTDQEKNTNDNKTV
jgi:hypothetical protein